jgi:hypothetical protein
MLVIEQIGWLTLIGVICDYGHHFRGPLPDFVPLAAMTLCLWRDQHG